MWELLVFLVLIVVPVVLSLREVPDRLRDLWAGVRGVVYVPALLVVLFGTATVAWLLAQQVTVLQWGWLGTNIVAAPLVDLVPAPEGGPGPDPPSGTGTGGGIFGPTLTLAVFVPFILLAFVVFNYYEEAFYRDSVREVALWAVLHLIMGIPLFAVIPIFAVGLAFKAIHDRRGLQTAYAAHFGMNATLLALMIATIVRGPAV